MNNHSVRFFQYKSADIRNIRVMCGLALFIAMYLALTSVTINLSATLRISFSFLATAASCYFYGLWPNLAAAFITDLLGYLIHPDGPYVPLFALVAMARACIYSFGFYRQEKISIPRLLIVQALCTILCNLILNPMILQMMYQVPFWSLLISRLVKNLALFPIECVLLYFVMQVCHSIQLRTSSAACSRKTSA